MYVCVYFSNSNVEVIIPKAMVNLEVWIPPGYSLEPLTKDFETSRYVQLFVQLQDVIFFFRQVYQFSSSVTSISIRMVDFFFFLQDLVLKLICQVWYWYLMRR